MYQGLLFLLFSSPRPALVRATFMPLYSKQASFFYVFAERNPSVKHLSVLWVAALFPCLCLAVGAAEDAPGRPVVVATAAIGCGGTYAEKMPLALECLHAAGQAGADIVCLPEEFCGVTPEPVPGPTTEAVSTLAKQYGMYVICPLCERSGDKEYNTAVLIDREGTIAGLYRKIFVFWGENVHAGEARVPYFDTDFGRISMLTCFDLNYPELWREASDNAAEIVFWPSAYGGGFPLRGYAGIHAYYVVSVGNGEFFDMTGEVISPAVAPRDRVSLTTLDLDRTLVHKDYNRDKVDALLGAHPDEITLERDWDPEGWYMLRAVKPGVRVRDLCRRNDIENLWEYRLRSREQIHERRAAGQRIGADNSGIPLGSVQDAPAAAGEPAWTAAFSRRVYDAWRRGHPMPQLSAVHPEATLTDAYTVQRRFTAKLGPIGGYKAAGVGSLEEHSPLVAAIPAAGVLSHADAVAVSLADGPPRHVETEIGYRFGKAVTEPPSTVEELRACVDAVMAIVELPGGAAGAFKPVTREDLVAWNINGKAMIVGPTHDPAAIDLDAVEITCTRDGEVINTARGDMAVAGQWPTLLKTVRHLLQQGYAIEPGHVITNGALGKIQRAESGAHRAEFGSLGSIAFQVQ